jgi:TolB-like protein
VNRAKSSFEPDPTAPVPVSIGAPPSPESTLTSTADLPPNERVGGEVPPPRSAPQPQPRPGLVRRHRWLIVSAVGALAVALVLVQVWRRLSPVPGTTRAASPEQGDLAVLPLQVLTPMEPRLEHLQVGIPDTIVTRLGTIRSLRLRPMSAVLRFSGRTVDARQAGGELRVNHVLTGTLGAEGDRYRMNLRLVRVADGEVAWNHRYDIAPNDLAGLQDDSAAEQVARALSLELTAAERARVHRRYTQNADAYAEFLEGRALLVQYTERRMREAIGKFEAALVRDPSYALARASLAMAFASYSVRYAGEDESGRWGARAEKEATLALSQDPSLAEAHLALASAAGTAYRNFDWPRMLDESAVALALDPNLHLAHTARARVFYHYGLFRQTEAEADTAATLAGESSVEDDRSRFYAALYDGRFAEAVTRGESLHKRTDAEAIGTNLALAFYYVGDKVRAFAALRNAGRDGVPDPRAQAALASIEAAEGRHDAARAIVRRVLAQPYRDHHMAYSLAATHAQLGQMDEAARWVMEAANTGLPCYPWFMRDPLLAPLRDSSQFRQIEPGLRRTFEVRSARYGAP